MSKKNNYRYVAYDAANGIYKEFETLKDAEDWLKKEDGEGIPDEACCGKNYIAEIQYRSVVTKITSKEDYHVHTDECPQYCDKEEWPYDSDWDCVANHLYEKIDWDKERTIKFRGKPTDEILSWVCGDLIRFPNGARGIHLLDADGSLAVKPETIGQFTGMFDKNGTEIYKGDVIKTPLGHIVEVIWGYKEHVVQLKGEECKDVFACNGWLFRNKRGHVDALSKDIAAGEVIGNIHDNPELKSYEGKDIYGLYFKVRISGNEEREKVVNHLRAAGFFYPDDIDKSKVIGILVGNAFIGEMTSECAFCDSRHQEYTVEEVLDMTFD